MMGQAEPTVPDEETDALVQFFLWATRMGYSRTVTDQEGALMTEAFVAGWRARP